MSFDLIGTDLFPYLSRERCHKAKVLTRLGLFIPSCHKAQVDVILRDHYASEINPAVLKIFRRLLFVTG